MANDIFVKGECRQCGGRMEFPAKAAGQTAACPHCGQMTELRGAALSGQTRRLPIVLMAAVLIVLAGTVMAGFFFKGHDQPIRMATTNMTPLTPLLPMVTNAAKPEVPELEPGEERTNHFDISPIKLEKTPGSSLVYVTGKVRNLTDRQRFGVKVEFALFDDNDQPIGHATDYQAVLDPNAEWDFRAMVMESKTVSARFDAILEDQ